jgi:hypothetical protein
VVPASDEAISVGYEFSQGSNVDVYASDRVEGTSVDHPGQSGWAISFRNLSPQPEQASVRLTTYCAVG